MALPYDFYPAVLYAIDQISQGETLSKACDLSNISVTTFHNYVNKDETLQAMYTEADQRGGDAMADALINIDNHLKHGQSDPKMAKVISDNIKWVLGKRKPKEYGDRVQVDHSISVDVAITTALDAARRRVPALENAEIVDADFTVMSEDDAFLHDLLS